MKHARKRFCPCNDCCSNQIYIRKDNLNRISNIEDELKHKQEELLCIDKELQRKRKQLNKLELKEKSNTTSKLKQAERKLFIVTKAIEKCKKYEKSKKLQNGAPANVVQNFFDKFIKTDKDLKNIAKVNKYDLLANMRRILFQPAQVNTVSPCGQSRFSSPSKSERKWNASARDCYLMSLQRTPQLWIYHRWPQFYPQYLSARAQWRNLRVFFMFLLGILFWVPAFLCLEICKCCFCSCCCDR
ncbi:unnamed protein product [Pieris macdunnoughi]|uniref:Uncharacterized protein n=1 Tax=Pieris macdunnoughi TaxID=345717 RepID=A0A821Q424_9NEOP|nr:unnamed protein product [Pieris macdunnoughi]